MDEQFKGWTLRHLDGTERGCYSTRDEARAALASLSDGDDYVIAEMWA